METQTTVDTEQRLEQQLEFRFINTDNEYLSVDNKLERIGNSFGGFKVVSHPGRLMVGGLYKDPTTKPLVIYEGVVDGKYSFIRQAYDFKKIWSERATGIYFINRGIPKVLITDLYEVQEYLSGSEQHANAKKLLVQANLWEEKPKQRRKRIKPIKEEQI